MCRNIFSSLKISVRDPILDKEAKIWLKSYKICKETFKTKKVKISYVSKKEWIISYHIKSTAQSFNTEVKGILLRISDGRPRRTYRIIEKASLFNKNIQLPPMRSGFSFSMNNLEKKDWKLLIMQFPRQTLLIYGSF